MTGPRIAVPESFRAEPRWWRDGTAWLDDLPELVADQCRRWHLTVDGPVRHGANALVVGVRRDDVPYALRMSPPGDDLRTEQAALEFWAGRGTVLVIDADHDHRAMLLERLDADRSLEQLPLREAVMIIGRLARRLAVPVAAPVAVDVRSTDELVTEDLGRFPATARALGDPLPDRLLAAVIAAGRSVVGRTSGDCAVNGDLHFGQVLRGQREPWLVVDPVLWRGDLAYDFGRVMWSRLDEIADDTGISAILRVLAAAAEVDVDHARAWVVYRSASYLFWGLEHGLTIDPVRCRRLLDALVLTPP